MKIGSSSSRSFRKGQLFSSSLLRRPDVAVTALVACTAMR